jgi:uracil-DNA glycosylase family 4
MLTAEEIARIPYRRGPVSAKVCIIGEAPGSEEEADPQKRPFIGTSGQLLETMLRKRGIDPSEVYFTNVIKERPDEKKIEKWIKLNKVKMEMYVELLNRELASLPNVNVFAPCGAVALQAVTGKKSIDSWRGSIIPATLGGIRGKKCVGMIHPAAIFRNWLYHPPTVDVDIPRIRQQSTFSEIKLPKRTYIIRPTYEQVLDFIDKCKKSSALLSIDLETLPRPQRIVSFQLAISPDEAICIPFQYRNGKNYWTFDQELIIWKKLVDLLENCGKRIIGQNILTFDLFMLAMQGFDLDKLLNNVFLDTMEGFGCLEPQLPQGLDFLTSIMTEEPYYKSEGKEWTSKQGEDEFWTYGCKDVMVVCEIAPRIYKELQEVNQLKFYYDRWQGLAYARLKMTKRGVRRDEKKRSELETKFVQDIVVEQAKLNVLVGWNVNVKSGPQMQKLLYQDMKLPKQYNREGNVTCDEDAILTLSGKSASPIFKQVLSIRHLRTLFSNNIKAKCDSDGRIRSSFGFTETGRFRSYACPLDSGGNLQNWTPSMRVMLVPDPGFVFVEGDLSQAEARIVAFAGHIKYMMDIFAKDPSTPAGDIHRHMAARIFNMLVENIGKKSPERYAAKRIVHASDYDMGPQTFVKRYNKDAAANNMALIVLKDAIQYLAATHSAIPELRGVYHAKIQECLKRNKTLVNPFGRRIVFHDRLGAELYRAGYAWVPQSTVADITNTILLAIARHLDILLQVHDSIMVQCRHDEVKDVIKEMRAANPTIIVGGMPLKIPMDFKTSDVSWMDVKDYKEELLAA